jgi:tRNA threonylcarbamoyladenosine biosynthesis protein TsaE
LLNPQRTGYKKSMPPPFRTRLFLPDEAATQRLGAALAALLRPGDMVALGGDLGAGKTRLARSVIEALLHRPEEVPSPTFTLVQTYDTPSGIVWHFDLYRLQAAEEALELGLEEALSGGIALIEWPDRLGALLPRDRLEITLAVAPCTDGDAREAVIAAHGSWAARAPALAAAAASSVHA